MPLQAFIYKASRASKEDEGKLIAILDRIIGRM